MILGKHDRLHELAERLISGKPILFKDQQLVNGGLLDSDDPARGVYIHDPSSAFAYPIFVVIVILSLIIGVLAVIPIGGADMPVVISLLNSYSGLAACAAGFHHPEQRAHRGRLLWSAPAASS